MIVLLILFSAISVFSQQFQYRLEGSFPTKAAPDPNNPATVNYSINWNETTTTLQGLYQDNYFGRTPRVVTGTVGPTGRAFNIILPEPISGVKHLIFSTPQTGTLSGSTSMSIVTRDNIGATIDNHPGFTLMTTNQLTTAAGTGAGPADQRCTVGFGALTRFCGVFNGVINEIADNGNRCDLGGRNPRLELAPDTVLRLILDYAPGVPNLPSHNIGAFIPSPPTSTILVSRRECGPLPGTTFEPLNCKTLNLSGSFMDQVGNVIFTGTYSINDDVNGDNCSYSMNMSRESIP